jgi:hypothetical protein
MSRKKSKSFYSSERIDRYDDAVKYRVIIGQRSNGKTYCIKKKIINMLAQDKTAQFAYIRRLQSHVSYQRLNDLFNDISDYCIEMLGDTISYTVNDGFYLTHDKERRRLGYKFSIEKSELDRGISFPNVRLIFLDEFMSIDGYFINEIDRFKSILSTIIRGRDDVQVYMVANTVNEISPYLDWLKIPVKKLKKGQVYYVEHRAGLKAVLEWCIDTEVIKENASKYFGTDDNGSEMILNGEWETLNLTTKEIDGITWSYKERRLIPVYLTGMGYVFELSYAKTKYPILFIRRINTQEGKVNTDIKFNLTLDETILKNKDGYVPMFKKVSIFMGDGIVEMLKVVDECIHCGRVIYTNALDGTRFLNIYNEIIKRK